MLTLIGVLIPSDADMQVANATHNNSHSSLAKLFTKKEIMDSIKIKENPASKSNFEALN